MVRKAIVLFSLLLVISLVGCNTDEIQESNASFVGVLTEMSENQAIVTPNEGEDIRSSGDAVSIGSLDEYNDEFEVGDTIKVTYTGGVMESYPLQVKVVNVEKIK